MSDPRRSALAAPAASKKLIIKLADKRPGSGAGVGGTIGGGIGGIGAAEAAAQRDAATFTRLRAAVEAICARRGVAESLEDLYRVRIRMRASGFFLWPVALSPFCMGVLDCVRIVTTTAFYRCIVPPFTPPRAQSVESLCLQKRAADVYTQLHAWLDEYLRASMSALHAAFARLDTPEFLGAAPQIFSRPRKHRFFATGFHKHQT
jgi:hypothetical protein